MADPPTVNQAADQSINVPSMRQALAAQLFDDDGCIAGTAEHPLYVVSVAGPSPSSRSGAVPTPLPPPPLPPPHDITHPTNDEVIQSFGGLDPVKFLQGDSPQQLWGLDSAVLRSTCPGIVTDGPRGELYDITAIISIMVAKIKQQQEQIDYLLTR